MQTYANQTYCMDSYSYPYRIIEAIEAIFNGSNLCLSQKSWSLGYILKINCALNRNSTDIRQPEDSVHFQASFHAILYFAVGKTSTFQQV